MNEFKQNTGTANVVVEALNTTTTAIVGAITELTDIMAEAHGITRKNADETQNLSGVQREAANAIKESVSATESVIAPTQQAAQGFNQWKAAIQEFNRGTDTLKQLPGTIRQIAAQKLDILEKSLISTRLQAGLLVGGIQTLARSKIDGAVSSFREFKATVTEGKTGLSGFVAGLKNIGKISIANTFNSMRNITAKTKEFAATKISGIVDGFKNLKSRITGINLSGLTSGLKNIAKMSLSALHTGLKKIGSLAAEAAGKIKDAIGGAVRGISVGIGAATAALGGLAIAGMKYNSQMEQYTTSFSTMLGSIEAGGQMVSDIKKMAAATPFEMTDLAKGSQTLLAFGLSADKVLPSLQMLGDVSQGNAERFDSLSLAFGQIQSAGKLTGQDLLQLINAGFNPLESMAQSTGKSMAQLKEEMSKGAISADMVTDAFVMATSEGGRFYNAMAEQSKTLSGQIATLKDNAMSLLGEVTQGLSDMAKETVLPKVNGYMEQLTEAFHMGGISGLVGEFGNVFASVVTEIANYSPKIVDMAVGLVDNLLAGIANSAPKIADGAAKAVTSFVSGIITLFPTLILTGADLIINFAGGVIQQLPQLIKTGIQAIGTLISGISSRLPTVIRTALNLVKTLVHGLIQNMPMIMQSGIQLIVGLLQGALSMLPSLIEMAVQFVVSLLQTWWGMLPQIAVTGIQMLASLIEGIFQMLPTLLQTAVGLVMNFVQMITQNLPMVLNAAVQLVVSLVQGIVSMLPMIIQSAIQLIITLITALIENWPLLVRAGYECIGALIGGVLQSIPMIIDGIIQLVGAILNVIFTTDWLQVGKDVISGIGKGLWDGIKGIFGGASKEGGEAMVSGAVEGAESGLSAITDASAQTASNFTAGLQPDYGTISGYGIEAGQSLSLGLATGTGELASTAALIGSDMAIGLSDGFAMEMPAAIDTATLMGVESVTGLSAGISDTIGVATDAAANVSAGVMDIFAGINLQPSGADAMRGFIDGLNSMRGSVMNTAKEIADSVKLTINSALDIHSPSRVMEESGEFTGEGFASGLTKMIDRVQAAARGLSDTTVEPFAVKGVGAVNPSGQRYGNSGSGAYSFKFDTSIALHDVGEKDPEKLTDEIMSKLYARLNEASAIISSGEMGLLL